MGSATSEDRYLLSPPFFTTKSSSMQPNMIYLDLRCKRCAKFDGSIFFLISTRETNILLPSTCRSELTYHPLIKSWLLRADFSSIPTPSWEQARCLSSFMHSRPTSKILRKKTFWRRHMKNASSLTLPLIIGSVETLSKNQLLRKD